jgi:hypothetical protein
MFRNSEAWHAKAVHLSNVFLPRNCPLLTHIKQSYVKNYIKDKLLALKERKAQEAKKEEHSQFKPRGSLN